MIIFTSGVPHGGKSELLKSIIPALKKEPIVLDPKQYLPVNYHQLSDAERTEYNIASWETCLDELEKIILKGKKDEVVIFDSAASKAYRMIPYFVKAKQRGHEVAYIYVEAKPQKLIENVGKQYLGDEIISRYFENFKSTMPKLRKAATVSFSVKNNKTLADLKIKANEIVNVLNKRI